MTRTSLGRLTNFESHRLTIETAQLILNCDDGLFFDRVAADKKLSRLEEWISSHPSRQKYLAAPVPKESVNNKTTLKQRLSAAQIVERRLILKILLEEFQPCLSNAESVRLSVGSVEYIRHRANESRRWISLWKRKDGAACYRIKNGCPKSVVNVLSRAHLGFQPNVISLKMIADTLEQVVASQNGQWFEALVADKQLCDLKVWVESSVLRRDYVECAVEFGLTGLRRSLRHRLYAGQLVERMEILKRLLLEFGLKQVVPENSEILFDASSEWPTVRIALDPGHHPYPSPAL